MSLTTPQASTRKKLGSNKLVLGFAALAATALLSVGGVAAAQTGSGYGGNNNGGATANVNLDFDVSGNNNVINIILNLFN